MRLCIDARPLLGNITGIANYTYNLIKSINQMDESITIKCFLTSLKAKKRKIFHCGDRIKEFRYIYPNKCLNYLWSYTQFPKVEWFVGGADIIHSTNYYYMPHYKSSRHITSVHDINFIKFEEFAANDIKTILKKRLKHFLDMSSCIITPTNSVKSDILDYFDNVEDDMIHVIPHGIDPVTTDFTGIVPIIKGDYILSVGSFIPRKNFSNLIKAFYLLQESQFKDLKLVIAGDLERDMQKKIGYYRDRNIILLDYISREKLVNLYQYAKVFVMPSIDEGFGFPVLESQSYGVPTANSDIPVFREIAGDSALYFSPHDIEDIADKISNCMLDSGLKHTLIQKGLENVKKYNWNDTAQKHIDLYRKCMDHI